nr:immunoglobulin heavy chain junction region [Macaca mulatta]MOX00402.1 immunoglobulin heavy chain junction region [Macaca mulatta]MOX01768.1 immunoglobulin heavy chain junction region [Macaca mulatta]MOX03276.1 immunoglobulin heavy chain junction region [Macaca mulatta]MOX03389.1 immunoglobulin heavy chain junction region [Macaca mulatta]
CARGLGSCSVGLCHEGARFDVW